MARVSAFLLTGLLLAAMAGGAVLVPVAAGWSLTQIAPDGAGGATDPDPALGVAPRAATRSFPAPSDIRPDDFAPSLHRAGAQARAPPIRAL